MDQINVQKAILVGHSMGGITSIKTSLRAPERVEKIVVEDMSVSQLTPKIVKMVQEYVGLTQEALDSIPDSVKDLDEAAKLYVEHIFKRLPPEGDNLTNTKNPESVRKFVIMKRNADGKFSVNYNNQAIIKALNDPQNLMSDPSGVFEGPACFIYGKLSPFITDGEECVIKKHFPNAKLVGIEGATHTVHVDRPKEFTEALLSFLQN
ncbi:protein ABHD11 [Caerostris darwini]|uniref:sn-1-specific diacylglycerol lipase ABHD11 n=1 Tax=Caerostris darwini TaxID=1538125 RepID=A0AAV4VPA0_9ARAC|nr:protein ABHD11 [Caerostris darwini]